MLALLDSRSARSVPIAPSPTSRRPSSFSLRSNDFSLAFNKTFPLSKRILSGTGRREVRPKTSLRASSLGVLSAGVGTCRSLLVIPPDCRLPRLLRARPSTALDEHHPDLESGTAELLQHDHGVIATPPGPSPRRCLVISAGSESAQAAVIL